MRKPIIGISTNTLIVENGPLAGLERAHASDDYIQSVVRAGGIPVLLPTIHVRADIEAQVAAIDGIILSGGSDIDPLLFGEEPIEKMGFMLPERDRYEIALCHIADTMNKPVFGICRGMQVLNVAFGGTLHQDITMSEGWYIKHSQNAKKDVPTHTLEIIPNTILHDIMGCETLVVNSFHHQAVKDIALGYVVTAWSKDGIAEAIERRGKSFLLAVQWHPELMAASHPLMQELFNRFVEEARR